jgi:2,4-dienoyl-CoA reductase-like NADH-dependent reductase (Old Yellow Enzyme family)/thioredoxin reductase
MNQFETLLSPVTIKGVSIRNRIVMPSIQSNFAQSDGSVSQRFKDFYVERGKGGAGLIIVSGAYIDRTAKKRAGGLLIDDDCFIPKLKEFAEALRATGARVLQQLNHNGRLVISSEELTTAVTTGCVGPSAVPHLLTGTLPRVLRKSEIQEIIEMFARAARRAKEAGFDGVELHGSHGYLINQFYSRYSNRRTDEYGGELENRMRFPVEVYRRVRELTGGNFLICYRLNGGEFAPLETPLADVIALSKHLEQEGVDILHISAGNGETPAGVLRMIPPSSFPQGGYAPLAAEIKANVKIPVITVGRINGPEIAEEILRSGKADLVATGRAFVADPYWPLKAAGRVPGKIRRCIGCNQGCTERLQQEQELTCLYNPDVGREGELRPSNIRKKILIIGGGPAGMEAAVIATERGHEVELYERGGELGGQIPLAAKPPGKSDFSEVKDFLVSELERLDVPFHLDEAGTIQTIRQSRPDAVIVATGSVPLIPQIPGLGNQNVITAWEVLQGKHVGQNIVVAGGGLVGSETALFLASSGKTVVLLEILDRVASDAGPLNRARLEDELRGMDIDVRCKTTLLKISEQAVLVRDNLRDYEIPAETVVLALGAKAENSLYLAINGKVKELYTVGDCTAPRNMLEAIHEAYTIAHTIS